VAPPQGTTTVRWSSTFRTLSLGATTTRQPVSRATPLKAASVCSTMGCPAITWYCLGWAVPAREPLPAHGIRANRRAASAGDVE
jgi:hypothetical protein